MATDRPLPGARLLGPGLLLLALVAAGCGRDAPAASEEGGTDGVEAAARASATGAEPSPTPTTALASPTAGWTDRRVLAEVDARFPHSEHRAIDCERCHVRPASHVTHPGAECVACHTRPAAFESLAERSARECASCHHAREERSCRSCHESDDIGARPVLATVHTAGGERVRVRSLTFAHALHVSVDCRSCHDDPVTRSFTGDCATCHEQHHRPDSQCTTCHESTTTPVHTSAVHSGCAGGGCHGDATVLALAPTRNVCITCHEAQVSHKPGRECASCHVGVMDSLGGARGAAR